MSEKTLVPDSMTVHAAGQLATKIDAIFRRGDDPSAIREAVMQAMNHFLGMLREHERGREAREKRVTHLASEIRQAVDPILKANYPDDEKYDALKEAFRYLDFVPVPF